MKNRSIFSILGISTCITLASVLAYAININDNNKSLNMLKFSSLSSSSGAGVLESKNENLEKFDSLYSAAALGSESVKQNFSSGLQCDVVVNNGFENLNTEEERILYNKMKFGCGKILNKMSKDGYEIVPITIAGKLIESAQIKKVFYALINDNPELFWISKTFKYGYYNGSNIITLHSVFSKEEKEKAERRLNEKILEIISKVSQSASDYEKELFLHDYIIDNCRYSKKATNLFSAYGCLVDGEAVCEGYSRAMQILLSRVGIESRPVSGIMEGEMHSWNIVKIDGQWYHLDVTGDSGGECQRYNYFNVDDDTIGLDHMVSEQLPPYQIWPQDKVYNFSLPRCNSIKENYLEKNAVKVSSELDFNKITHKLVEIANNKKKLLYIKVSKNLNINEIKNKLISSRIFECIRKANDTLKGKLKINTSRVIHSMCKTQNAIVIKLDYIV